jgi:hypothetical protein
MKTLKLEKVKSSPKHYGFKILDFNCKPENKKLAARFPVGVYLTRNYVITLVGVPGWDVKITGDIALD